jgi:DNA-binding GntR family transcriptional regulator
MEPVREAARRLVAQGALDITQKGHVVDGSTAKGPIRLRRRG